MKLRESLVALSVLCVAAPVFAGGSVKGKVTYGGDTVPARADMTEQIKAHPDHDICMAGEKAKEDLVVDSATKGIEYVFVSIEKVTGGKTLEVPAAPIVSDQKSCHFDPHILVVPKGAKVELKNSDSKLHNTHSWSKKNPTFNEGIAAGKSITKEFKDTEKVKLSCDVHPWMAGYIIVTDTPYYAVTTKDGSFEIKDLPAGKWTVKIWHETLGNMKEDVTVADGAAADVNFKMPAKGAN